MPKDSAVDQLESVVFWMDDLLRLALELQKDLKNFYEPVKGWPPHIQALEGSTDYHAALEEGKKFLKRANNRMKPTTNRRQRVR